MSHLAAVKTNRHTIALAIFSGLQLKYVQSRRLPTSPTEAERSAIALVERISYAFPISSVAFEKTSDGTQSANLAAQLARHFRDKAVPLTWIASQSVIESFTVPTVRKRHAIRQITAEIWPSLKMKNQHPTSLDAAALGLFVETERLLNKQAS
jgi:hypothetical protein